jgi:ATP-dependent helicase/nuclease subunit A
MTVHAAKGLEFPIVVLVGLNADRSRSDNGPVIVNRQSGAIEVGIGSQDSPFQTPGYQALSTIEKELAEQEFVRLLYVAATRARDHLVVSMFRTASDTKSAAALIAEMMEGHDHLWEPAPYADVRTAAPEASPASPEPPPTPSMEARERWLTQRESLVAARSRPATVAATTLGKIAKDEAVSEEPWRRGRGGTSLGRAVHAVLQTVDLATGSGLDDTASAQATAEGIAHRTAEVARLARVAMDSDVVRRAVASGGFWREVPVAAPLGRGAIDGFIDLLFQEDGHLIVVDYKTDALEVDETADAAQRYRLQAGAYALALMESTGQPVREVVFLFLQPRREEVLGDIDELVSEARAAALQHLGEAAP